MSGFPTDDAFLNALVTEASRAPSVHNTQGARWRLGSAGVELWARDASRLPVADASGHDERLSFGSAWEGLALAALRRGWRLGDPQFTETWGSAPPAGLSEERQIARASWEGPAKAAPLDQALLEQVWSRRCHRGAFRPPTAEQAESWRAAIKGAEFSCRILEGAELTWVNRLGDKASASLFLEDGYPAELRRWLRLKPTEDGYFEWGLNREALDLAPWEAAAAALAFQPRWMAGLKHTPMIAAFCAEAPKANTAWAALLQYAPEDEDPFFTGRRQYRFWLHLAGLGLATWPLSAVVDVSKTRAELSAKFLTPPGQRLLNVVRVGSPDKEKFPTSRMVARRLWEPL